jgi:hypothetical protein
MSRSTCTVVCSAREPNGSSKASLQPLPSAETVWERIAMDIFESIQENYMGYK